MGARVLIVDGDSAFAGSLQSGLARLGCTSSILADGGAALVQATRDRPDLIVAATELPDMSGLALCDQLRSDASLMIVPVVLLAEGATDDQLKIHQESPTRAEEYVRKPVGLLDLFTRIGRFLGADAPMGETGDEDLMELSSVEEIAPTSKPAMRPPPPPKTPTANVGARKATTRPPRHVASAELEESSPPPPVEPPPSSKLPQATPAPPGPTTSMRPPGMSTRDYLDVRELLSAKEREILKLKDAARAADDRAKEIEERFSGLQHANHDLLERIAARDRALADGQAASTLIDAVRADKELAQKRADDFAKRLERAKASAEPLRQELAAEKERRAADAAAHEQAMREATAAHEAKLEERIAATRAELEEAHERTISSLREDHATETARMREEHANAIDGLRTEHEAIATNLREEQRKALTSVEMAKADARIAAIADTDRAVREELVPKIVKLEQKLETTQSELARLNEERRLSAETHERALAQAVSECERAVRDEMDAKMSDLRAQTAREIETIERASDDQVAETLKDKDRGIARVEEEKARALAELRDELERARDEALAARDLVHANETNDRDRRHAQELADANSVADRARHSLRMELEQAREQALLELMKSHEAARQKIAEERARERKNFEDTIAERDESLRVAATAEKEWNDRRVALNAEIAARKSAIERLAGELAEARLRIANETDRANRAEDRRARDKITLDEARKALEEAIARVDSAREG